MNRRKLLLSACALASMPVAAWAGHKPPKRPNILYIKFDDMDDHNPLSFMPNYLSASRKGIRFVNSFVDASSCGPSRVSTLTGMALRRHGMNADGGEKGGYKRYEPLYGVNALPVSLKAVGYRTSAIGRYMTDMGETDPLPAGIDDAHLLCGSERPFTYRKFVMNDNGVVTTYHSKHYVTDVLRDKALDFIQAQKGDKPWFMYLCTSAPHGSGFNDVGDAPEPAAEDLDIDVGDQPQRGNFNEADVSDKPHGTVGDYPLLNPAEANFIWQCRRRTMMSVDRMIGALMDALKDTRQETDTYVIIDSDNGYSEGAHRLEEKIMLYEESQRVPLMISGPHIPKTGQERTELVNNLDTSATIFDLAGAKPFFPLDGESLAPLFSGKAKHWRDDIFFENGRTKGVRTAVGELYAETTTAEFGVEREYYALDRDPLEMGNAIGGSANAKRVAQLSARLATLRVSGE